ncbi:hypothetical protein [Akkermansia sp.]|uniref:hypothetical protein n=1 Tax=Akkermansia sp. TaxID=1872421 RepID=UPI0025BB4EE0|nr:hypothetical protein [Akkermansia sp.]MCC8149786.1 hypothetical protein [Akkermansia sp.]
MLPGNEKGIANAPSHWFKKSCFKGKNLQETGSFIAEGVLPENRNFPGLTAPARASGTISFLRRSGVLIRSQRKKYVKNMLIKNSLQKKERALIHFPFLSLYLPLILSLRKIKTTLRINTPLV